MLLSHVSCYQRVFRSGPCPGSVWTGELTRLQRVHSPPDPRSSRPEANPAARCRCSPSAGGSESGRTCTGGTGGGTELEPDEGDVCYRLLLISRGTRTRFPSCLRSSHSGAEVWTVQEETDTERPFLTDSGPKTTTLGRGGERERQNNIIHTTYLIIFFS